MTTMPGPHDPGLFVLVDKQNGQEYEINFNKLYIRPNNNYYANQLKIRKFIEKYPLAYRTLNKEFKEVFPYDSMPIEELQNLAKENSKIISNTDDVLIIKPLSVESLYYFYYENVIHSTREYFSNSRGNLNRTDILSKIKLQEGDLYLIFMIHQ